MLSNKLALLTVLASMAGLVSAAPSSDVGAGKRFNKARECTRPSCQSYPILSVTEPLFRGHLLLAGLDTRWGRHGGHGGHHSQGNDQASASAVASSAASDNETAPVTSSYAAAAVETFAAAVATTSAAAAVPTTAAAAAATTTAASSSGSSDVKTGGIATYFLQGGNAGGEHRSNLLAHANYRDDTDLPLPSSFPPSLRDRARRL